MAVGEEDPMRRYRRLLPYAVACAILVAVAVAAYARMRSEEGLGATLLELDGRLLVAALAFHVVSHLFWSLRMSVLAGGCGLAVGPGAAWRLVTSGVFGGAVSPGRIGGEALKLALLVRGGARAPDGTRLLLADRGADLLFFLAMGAAAVLALPRIVGPDGATAGVLAALGTLVLAAFVLLVLWILVFPRHAVRPLHGAAALAARLARRPPPDLQHKGEAFVRDVRAGLLALAAAGPLRLVASALLTACNWFAEYMALYLVLRAFGVDLPYALVLLTGIVLTLVSNIPVTPGGTGVAEATALALVTPLAPTVSPLFVIVWRGVTYYYDIVVGGLVASWSVAVRARFVRAQPQAGPPGGPPP